jgi:hypothetical protein
MRAADDRDLATSTVRCLERHVPAAVPASFLSGGQDHLAVTTYLNAINRLTTPKPWTLTFSCGRAPERGDPSGEEIDKSESGSRLPHRARCCSAAARDDTPPPWNANPSPCDARRAAGAQCGIVEPEVSAFSTEIRQEQREQRVLGRWRDMERGTARPSRRCRVPAGVGRDIALAHHSGRRPPRRARGPRFDKPCVIDAAA